jgi:hypothetical protein
MIRAVPARILRQILLVIVGDEEIYPTENARLRRRGELIGRFSVDVAVGPPVDQTSVRSEQCPSLLTPTGLSGTAALQQAVYSTE